MDITLQHHIITGSYLQSNNIFKLDFFLIFNLLINLFSLYFFQSHINAYNVAGNYNR